METTYELIKAARGLSQGKFDNLRKLFDLSLDDIFFQMQFVMNEERKITDNLEDFYINLAGSAFVLGAPEGIAQWLNESAHSTITKWMNTSRREMLSAEERGMYDSSQMMFETFVPGREADEIEYTRAIEEAICKLPEIHRQTAIAFYYDDLPMESMEELFMVDSFVINKRITYIEKNLSQYMSSFCKEHRYQIKKVSSQRIRSALIELASMYKYPYADALFENVRVKSGRFN